MHAKPNLTIRQLGSRYMIIDGGQKQSDATAIHTLNATAADIWNYCSSQEDFTAEDVARYLCINYIVDAGTALSDAEALIQQWKEQGLLEE